MEILTYKGKNIEELTRDELLEALRRSFEMAESQRKQRETEREMMRFLRTGGT